MSMLVEDKSFHSTHEGINHLSDMGRSTIELMSSTVSETAISALLESLDRGQQYAAIASFI